MNSNALQNLKNEIATNLHLTSSTPSSTAGSDGRASLSGVLKVLQRLMRKLHSSRSIYSTKPTKHVVYLFGCGPYSAHESSSPETLTSTFSQGEKNISQSSNILCDTLAKLKEHNMHLVWICYGPREQLLKSVVSGLNKVNPTDRWAQYQSYVELKDFRDLFTATEPISRLLAFSLENKLRENATSGKQRQNKRKGNGISRIVFEKRGKGHRNQLFCLSNVRIQSAVNSKQQNEHETTFLVSHYLKDWDSSSFPKGSTEAKPKTLKPKATEDAQAFNSFMLFLVRTKAVAVATEFVVDHKNQNLSSRLVVIAPFNSMIASVCRIPFHIKQRILQGSSSPVTYSQWKKCCTNEMKRMGTELTGADASSEVYNEYISTPTVGSTRKECLDTVDIDRLPKKHQSPPGSAAIFKDDIEDNKTPPISSSGDDFHANKPTTLHSKLFIHEKGTYSSTLAKSSTVPTASKNVVAKKSLKSAVNVTKHGFRYKRVYANKQTSNGQVEQSNPGGGLRLTKPNVSTSELVVPDSTLKSSRLVLSKTTPCFKSAGKVSGSKDCKSRNINKAVGWSSAVESESLCTQNRQSPLVSQKETGCSSQRDLEAQRLTAATAPTASITEVEKVQVTQSKKPTECNADLGATEGRRNHAFSKGVQSLSTHKTIHQKPLASLSPERMKRPRPSMAFKLATQTNPRHVKSVGRKKLGSLHIIETDTDDKRMANSNERPFYAQQQNSPSADPYFASNEQGTAHEGGGKGGIAIDAEHQSLQRAEPRLKSSKARRTRCERTTGNKIEIVQKENFFNSPESLGVSAVPPFEQPKPSSNSETVSLLQFDGAPSVGVRLTTYISDATREFDGVINQLLNHAPETRERLVRRAMAQLSKIAKQIANSQCSWPQIYSILKSRLKADDHVIASMQAEQNSYFSKEHGQVKTMNGRLWKVVLEAFEQVIWLLVGVMDPKLKTSLKSDSKQELFRRATTILSCAQITAELMSSGFDSSLVFRRVLDSFFHTTLSHFAQASQNVNLKHWTGIVFEHFEKDVPSAGSFGISADDSKPAKPLRGIDQTSCSEDTKPITRTLSGGRYQKAPRSNLSSFLQGRKRSVRKTGPLHNNPAFRRGKPFAFGGVSKKKVNPTNIESLSKPACPSQVLDKLIHMGSLQSSLDAIQVPQTKEHGVCEEEVEATDDETEGASLPISHTTPELGIKSCPEDEPRKSDAFCSGVQITEVPCRSKASFGIEDISTKDETSTKMASGFTAVSKLGTDVEIPSNLSGPSNGKRGRMSRRCSPNKAQEKRDAHQGITDRYASDRSPCTKMKETDKEQNLRNEKVKKCMRKDPEAHAESTTNPQLNTKTQQDLDGQVSTVCELPNNETSKAMERCSVKKRKLQLKNESTPHASVEDTDEPSPKKPRTAEQKPTLSLFGRIREVVSKSINLGGCSLGGS